MNIVFILGWSSDQCCESNTIILNPSQSQQALMAQYQTSKKGNVNGIKAVKHFSVR